MNINDKSIEINEHFMTIDRKTPKQQTIIPQ